MPHAGRVLSHTSSREGKLGLLGAVLLFLAGWEIRRTWWTRESTA